MQLYNPHSYYICWTSCPLLIYYPYRNLHNSCIIQSQLDLHSLINWMFAREGLCVSIPTEDFIAKS